MDTREWENLFNQQYHGLSQYGHKMYHDHPTRRSKRMGGNGEPISCGKDNKCKYMGDEMRNFIRELLEARTKEVLTYIVDEYGSHFYDGGDDERSESLLGHFDRDMPEILKHFGIE